MSHSSLQKRFIWLAVPLLMIIAMIIYYSQSQVNQTANESIRSIATIRQLERSINEIRSSLQTLEQLIYQRTVISYNDNSSIDQALQKRLTLLTSQINYFVSNPIFDVQWQEGNKQESNSFGMLSVDLKKTLQRITRYLNSYNRLLSDVRVRFPSSQLVIDELFPLNTQFAREINITLEEIDNAPKSGINRQIQDLLKELRYSWLQQTSLFRLFIGNRSGMFDTPKAAMTTNLQDREIFWAKVDVILSELEALDEAGKLPFQTSFSVAKIRQIYRNYETTFADVKKTYMSENWRVDHQFLNTKLQPELKTATQIIERFSNEIKTIATETITQSQNVARNITIMIWLSGGVLIGLMVLGYLIFEHLIRRPVLVIADAMNAEANGESFYPLMDSNTRETKLLVDAFKNMQQQVHSRQARLESILGSAAEGIITADESGMIESFNEAAEKLFGYKEEEVIGNDINILIPEKFRSRQNNILSHINYHENASQDKEIEISGQHKDGSMIAISIKLTEMIIEGRKLYTAMVDDVSERTAMIQNLRILAEHDSLTGLYNRYFFLHELERVVQRSSRGQHADVALLYIDLDNFKFVNDTMGHLSGDKLLVEIAGIFKQRSREADLVARIGGDEFAIILYDVNAEHAIKVADSFRQKLQDYHFTYEGRVSDIGCSVGIAMVEKSMNKDELLACADFACHAAKRSGRNRIHLYTDNDKRDLETLSDDMGWVRRIKHAIDHDRFMFVVQPIISTDNHKVNQYEVLLRMLDDGGKLIMPSGFIPPAERFGLMPDIDKWVVNHAIDYLASEMHNNDFNLSINLSAPSFGNKALITFITEKIDQNGINPTAITFEITETVAMADLELTVTFLKKLRALGCRTALDDFGVGYSSFAYLKNLPVDYVKIDGSFVRDIESNELNRAIVKSMNDVAQAMGKLTVAEFVETEKTMQMLELIGVDYLQGYYIGKPEVPPFETKRNDITEEIISISKSSSV